MDAVAHHQRDELNENLRGRRPTRRSTRARSNYSQILVFFCAIDKGLSTGPNKAGANSSHSINIPIDRRKSLFNNISYAELIRDCRGDI